MDRRVVSSCDGFLRPCLLVKIKADHIEFYVFPYLLTGAVHTDTALRHYYNKLEVTCIAINLKVQCRQNKYLGLSHHLA